MFKAKNFVIMALVAVAILMTVGSVLANESITIQGSTTVLPIAQRAAEVFMENNSDVDISVRGGGSGAGIAALIDDACDIADASRFIKDSEVKTAVDKGIYPVPHRVAMDGIAIIINPSNKVNKLTLEQIRDIYTGKITNWNQVGGANKPIVIISRDSSSGTFEVFGELVLEGEKVVQSALLQASNGAVAGVVAETDGAIGYIGLGYLSNGVKAVEINGILPSVETVQNGTWPVARPLFMFTDGWPEGAAKSFINFLLSTAGQEIVSELGFVPLY